jgi:hypothetical protein
MERIIVEDSGGVTMNALNPLGVTVVRGAVAGARSVPPLAVVVGNPTRIVKHRLPGELADAVLGTALMDRASCVSEENALLFERPLTLQSLIEIRSACRPRYSCAREGSTHAE